MTRQGSFHIGLSYPIFIKADFFETGNFQTLTTFNDLYEVGCGGKSIVTPRVEPCCTSPEQFDGQLVQFEIGSI